MKIFEKTDIMTIKQQKLINLYANGSLHGFEVEWTRKFGDRDGSAQYLTSIEDEDLNEVIKGMHISLPILLYYGTGRL